MHILLTGSTGNVGAYILSALLSHPPTTISHVTLLNRSGDAASRQHESHLSRGLTTDFSRCTFLTGSFSSANLGLAQSNFDRLANRVTTIVHNAWTVDFNLSFSSFRPSIEGIANLIAFTQQAPQAIKFFFVSSVSVVGRWGAMPGTAAKVPEVVVEDWRTAKLGYGQSKLVAERLLVKASEEMGLDVGILRVGQVAGPVECAGTAEGEGKGANWNEKEWLPSLVKSSLYLGQIPKDLGPMERIDWIPIDVCGRVIAELAVAGGQDDRAKKRKEPALVRVYHVTNPNETAWADLLPAVLRNLPDGQNLKGVSFVDWVDALVKSAKRSRATDVAGETNPAAKLASFFEELQDKARRFPKARAAMLDTAETVEESPALARLEAVGGEWMELWMRQWRFR